jgi:ABC-type phosphate transport system substrate-binding protein
MTATITRHAGPMNCALTRALLLAAALAFAGPARAGNITVKGSDTLVVLAQKWAEAYMSRHPDTKIQVTGGGTGTGFAALQNKTTDLCKPRARSSPASRPTASRPSAAGPRNTRCASTAFPSTSARTIR